MAREYEAKTSKWWVAHNVFMQVRYMILDYDRMKRAAREAEADILYGTQDKPVGTSGPGDPTASKALLIAALDERVNAIDQVIFELRELYAEKICTENVERFDPIDAFDDYGSYCFQCYRPADGSQPANITWKEYRRMFIYKVAKKMHYF